MSSRFPSRQAFCRLRQTCESCLTRKCLWIGDVNKHPCRKGLEDVEDELIQLPVPKTIKDCNATRASTTSRTSMIAYDWPTANKEIRLDEGEILQIGLFVVSALLILAALFFLVVNRYKIRRIRRASLSSHELLELKET